ncbi:hypothetical protein HJG60_009392 [Phyllostomus discolor]|uniref:Uncharacterized protein n=1 Tax=Phyllostomus discolor TaxID=89673 RepID=A0A833YFK9_9CHIR|nr:hypothetical protein HJG60_009392 [Phyllostomus discolor]
MDREERTQQERNIRYGLTKRCHPQRARGPARYHEEIRRGGGGRKRPSGYHEGPAGPVCYAADAQRDGLRLSRQQDEDDAERRRDVPTATLLTTGSKGSPVPCSPRPGEMPYVLASPRVNAHTLGSPGHPVSSGLKEQHAGPFGDACGTPSGQVSPQLRVRSPKRPVFGVTASVT